MFSRTRRVRTRVLRTRVLGFPLLSPGHLRPRFFLGYRRASFGEPLLSPARSMRSALSLSALSPLSLRVLSTSPSCAHTRLDLQRVIPRLADTSNHDAIIPVAEAAFRKDLERTSLTH